MQHSCSICERIICMEIRYVLFSNDSKADSTRVTFSYVSHRYRSAYEYELLHDQPIIIILRGYPMIVRVIFAQT